MKRTDRTALSSRTASDSLPVRANWARACSSVTDLMTALSRCVLPARRTDGVPASVEVSGSSGGALVCCSPIRGTVGAEGTPSLSPPYPCWTAQSLIAPGMRGEEVGGVQL
ncbi:hypothetical protein COCON_G00070100 [Conger conger]|uniref:Uncharacterized protein n=1 Tax=Conger conger TaxID=82655 RepID=A0A9Q1DTM7_CONCO|nr:hypothetical protein COCON_G00070100 [Conger conger]